MNSGLDSWFSKSLSQMQDHGGVVTQEDDEEVGSITCKSDREMTQVGVPDNEICDELNTPRRDYV